MKDMDIATIVSIIRGDIGRSVLVSSALRRAVSTGFLALSPRLVKSPETDKFKLLTSLQEISRNVDTLAIAPAHTSPQPPMSEASMANMGDLMTNFYRTRIDPKLYSGNKSLSNKAKDRHEDFINWAFEQKED